MKTDLSKSWEALRSRPTLRSSEHTLRRTSFRITYEARQKIRGLCGDGTPSAEVSSGLLVFPGKHCRLSNLDSEGRYISTERYRVGNSEVVHLSGLARNAGLCSGL